MSLRSRWHDLAPRVVTGVSLLAVGAAAIWAGGVAFAVVIGLSLGLMYWELAGMLEPRERTGAYLLIPLGLAGVILPSPFGWPALIVALIWGAVITGQNRWRFVGVGLVMSLGALGLLGLRDGGGAVWVLWVVLVVVATDVAGYFAGRYFGGPLFWPRVSPKKTWAGTSSGWVAAAIVGFVFAANTVAGPWIIALSVLVSLASQAGDLAESALKRQAGVKDSSNLLPGHGGVMDRFDGMLGAALFLLLAEAVIVLPF